MKASPAPTCIAVDTEEALDAYQATKLAASFYGAERIAGVCGYVSLSQPQPGDMTLERAQTITRAGLGLWLIQHPYYPGWTPSDSLGSLHGAAAARNARLCGYGPGSHLGIDIEGIKPGTSKQAVIDYIGRRTEEGLKEGYRPIVYWGFDSILTGEDFWELPTVHLYWSDFAKGKSLPHRGFAVTQFAPNILLAGIRVDLDRIAPDFLGGNLVWTVDDTAEPRV